MTNTRTDDPIETHLTCPHCGGNGCYSIWEDGGYYCHQCEASGGKTKEVKGMFTHPELDDREGVEYRSIKPRAARHYGILTSYDSKGEMVRRVYPYPHKDKYRYLPKDFTKNKGFTTDHLFGMDKFNAGSSKFICVVEGEEDTASAYQMLEGKVPVVGLPSASVSRHLLKNCHEYLDSFENIVLCMENDPAGEKAAEKIYKAFPSKTYRVILNKHKDANEFLQAGDAHEFRTSFWNSRTKYTPSGVYNSPSEFKDIIKGDTGYAMVPTGIKEFDDSVGGVAQGAFTVIQAPEGVGKTELMRKLEYNLLSEYPTIPFATMHLEETKKRGLLGLASYHLKKNVTIQDSEFQEDEDGDLVQVFLPFYRGTPEDEVLEAVEEITSKENFYQFGVDTDADAGFILDRIRYFAEVCDCKYIMFEPIQDLAYSLDSPDGVEPVLRNMSSQLARLAAELNVGIITIAHENDDGQVRDSRMISKRAHVVVKLSRDKMATDEDVKNTTTLTVVKNRPTSYTGYAGQVIFDPETFTLEEVS